LGSVSQPRSGVVIVGAGQAGVQAAVSLRLDGFRGSITLIGDEPGVPYLRPPLSKAYLKHGNAARLDLRSADFFAKSGITLMTPASVVAIDAKLPWFWSDQGPHKLQIAGLARGADRAVARGSYGDARWVSCAFKANQLIAVETVNLPAVHMAARMLLAQPHPVTLLDLEAVDFDVAALARRLHALAP
jgi:hypothetical protein